MNKEQELMNLMLETNKEMDKSKELSSEGIGIVSKINELVSLVSNESKPRVSTFGKVIEIGNKLQVHSKNINKLHEEVQSVVLTGDIKLAINSLKEYKVELKKGQDIFVGISELYDETVGEMTSNIVC